MKFDRLQELLNGDPGNLSLLAAAAEAAWAEREFDACEALLNTYAAKAPEGAAGHVGLANLRGMLALERRDYPLAAHYFAAALQVQDDPAIRFNLAWAKAMAGAFADAAEALDDQAALAAPRGPALKVRALHHLGKLDEAVDAGMRLYAARPRDQELAGALALAALDADRVDLARRFGGEGGTEDAVSTRAILALDEGERDASLRMFEDVLAKNPDNPRALTGKGLCLLETDPAAAARCLDRASEIFASHSGSWVAAGWAHFVQKNFAVSRARFEKAIALDPSFSEGHGGVAALEAVSGDMASARRHADIATKLDRQSFGGALANVFLLSAQGDHERAARVRDVALATPIGPGGKTIAQAMAQLGRRGPNL
jgi:tetratricopeptide (TPR) repeat protein